MFHGAAVLMVVFGLLFVVIFVTVVVVMVTSVSRSRRALRDGGLDPLAAEAQLAARAANSQLLAPRRPLEERLRELDDLHTRGVISTEEHAAARAAALADG